MTNLEASLKRLLTRAHRARRPDDGCLHTEGGLSMMFGSFGAMDPEVPVLVNAAGRAKLPPRSKWVMLKPDNADDDWDRVLGANYVVERGRIKHLRLDRLGADDEFWWLMMVTAINAESAK